MKIIGLLMFIAPACVSIVYAVYKCGAKFAAKALAGIFFFVLWYVIAGVLMFGTS